MQEALRKRRVRDLPIIIGALMLLVLLDAALSVWDPSFSADQSNWALAFTIICVGVVICLYANDLVSYLVAFLAIAVSAYINMDPPIHAIFRIIAGGILFFFVLRVKRETVLLHQEHLKKERELEAALKELERTSARKDDVLVGVSHDLRTPLSIIRSNLATIRDGYAGKVNREARTYVDSAYRASDRLGELIEGVLTTARVEESPEVLLRPVQIEKLVRSIIRTHGSKARVPIDAPHEPDRTPMVWADPALLQRALENVLVNAMKFTHKGRIEVRVEERGDVVACTIRDTGIGIPEKDIEKVFSKFYRGANSEGHIGSGLGLYIAKSAIEQQQGKIRCTSKVARGTTFIIEMPIVKRKLRT